MKHWVFIGCFLFSFALSAQDSASWRGVVIDGETNAKLPFTRIFCLSDRHGTISRADGSFQLDAIAPTDTIVFRASGYETIQLLAIDQSDTVRMYSQLQLLESVLVLSDVSVLYDMVRRSRKTVSNETDTAKTYFELKSFEGVAQLELFQAYYNGIFDGYDLEGTELKTARFGLKKNRGRYFVSMESSRAIREHKLFEENAFFPTSPFELNGRKLKQLYRLELAGKLPNKHSGTTYAIRFEPKNKEDRTRIFSGMVWMDSASCRLEKVELSIEQTSRHPFEGFFRRDLQSDVGLYLRKTFTEESTYARIQSIDFNYTITTDEPMFLNLKEDQTIGSLDTARLSDDYLVVPEYTISTSAFLYAYDYDSHFKTALFDFPAQPVGDYRKLYALGKNPDFWNCYAAFKIPDNEKNTQFLADTSVVQEFRSIRTNFANKNLIHGGIYIPWSPNRIIIRRSSFESSETATIPATTYQLKGQILLEVNDACGPPTYQTRCILDPYETYYNLPIGPTELAFINMYYDLLEIERRALEEKLKNAGTDVAQWYKYYEEYVGSAEKKLQNYLREVDRGTKWDVLVHWNDIIREQLGIDNIAIFEIEAPEE